jgi:hypothetical protein
VDPIVFYYFGLKLAAYVGWCLLGLYLAARTPGVLRFLGLGAAFGVVRLLIGWVVGIPVGFLIFTGTPAPLLYFAVLVPVRWFEWGIMEALIFKDEGDHPFVVGRGPKARFWRIGGIVVSCAADLPFLLHGGGFPSGRIFC